ncbi:hypothetical protein HQ584_09610 [Patescibacteria group bacterium]|nr:hypothetical protein [Patescibacteria group bacterium]
MDEPFSALDPLIRIKMQVELLELRRRLRRTIFFVTHDLDEALKLGDRIAIMEEGEIVQIGIPEEIILNPRTEYVADFVKNADPSGVLTAGKVITLEHRGKVATKDTRYYPLDKKSSLLLELDRKNRPIKVMAGDKPIFLRDYHNIKEIKEEDKGNCIFVAPEHTVLREIMEVKIYSDFPLIIVSQEGVFKGIITEKDILQILLKKGEERKVLKND